ncbi:histone-lysine N-methyltransferase SETMAR-like [Octopus sinensis]|uniref:Histone-lysine N-methyltransferase SETMAR-like n=1 Tax=Octopus sinensis TaxID=2607531 RepID=A0A6P7S9X8_9MOLL|nr:histone-lysine N-methyltransferase SETMAR-like [Octopus sinensis]
MPMNKIELRVLIRYYWKRGLSTRKAAEGICAAEGEGTIAYAAISKWYKRFDSGDMTLEDKPRSGRPLKLDDGDLQTGLNIAPSSSTRELADELGVGKSTIHRHLRQLDFVHKKPRQDPHELTEAQANRRVEICRQLLSNPLDDWFWKRIVTSDEKWVYLVQHN